MGHSSVNETRCTIVFSFAFSINHLIVWEVVLSVALLLSEHWVNRFVILQSTAHFSKTKALSKHLLDSLYLTLSEECKLYIQQQAAAYELWHVSLYISKRGWDCLLRNNGDYPWHFSSTPDFHVTALSSVVAALSCPHAFTCVYVTWQPASNVCTALQRDLQLQIREQKAEFMLSPSVKNKEYCVARNGSRRRDKGWQLWKETKALSVSTLSPAAKSRWCYLCGY